MARPSTSPIEWATDATHPAGADPWSGLANKVAPSAGKIASGWEPEDNPQSEHMNYVLNNFADWLRHLNEMTSKIQVLNWTKHDFAANNGAQFFAADWDGTSWVAVIDDSNAGTNAITLVSNDGVRWFAGGAIGIADVKDVASDRSQNSVAVGISGGLYSTANSGSSWTSRTPAAATAFKGVVWNPIDDHFVTFGDAGVIEYSSNKGVTWNGATEPSATSPQVNGMSVDPVSGDMFAFGVASGPVGFVWKSTDGGVNWTDVTPGSGVPTTFADATYDKITGRHVAISGTNIYAGDDSAGFTTIATGAAVSGTYIEAHDKLPLLLIFGGSGGIIFSTDGGETWLTEYELNTDLNTNGASYANGYFILGGFGLTTGGHFYVSLRL